MKKIDKTKLNLKNKRKILVGIQDALREVKEIQSGRNEEKL